MARVTSHLAWQAKAHSRTGEPYIYARSARGRWDGDAFGNEWLCGYSITRDVDGGWSLWEDDETGSGDGLGTYPTIWLAAIAANAHDVQPSAPIDRWFTAEERAQCQTPNWTEQALDESPLCLRCADLGESVPATRDELCESCYVKSGEGQDARAAEEQY